MFLPSGRFHVTLQITCQLLHIYIIILITSVFINMNMDAGIASYYL